MSNSVFAIPSNIGCVAGILVATKRLTLFRDGLCQEIGLVALMFFFELLFSLCFFVISFYVSFTDLFSIILFPYLLTTRDTQNEGEARFNLTNTGTV